MSQFPQCAWMSIFVCTFSDVNRRHDHSNKQESHIKKTESHIKKTRLRVCRWDFWFANFITDSYEAMLPLEAFPVAMQTSYCWATCFQCARIGTWHKAMSTAWKVSMRAWLHRLCTYLSLSHCRQVERQWWLLFSDWSHQPLVVEQDRRGCRHLWIWRWISLLDLHTCTHNKQT